MRCTYTIQHTAHSTQHTAHSSRMQCFVFALMLSWLALAASAPTPAPTSSCSSLSTSDEYNGACVQTLGLTKSACLNANEWCCQLRARFVNESWYDITQSSTYRVNATCYKSSTSTWYLRIKSSNTPNHPYSTPNSLQIKSYDKLIQLNTTLDLDKAYQDPYSSTLYGAVGMMINGVVFFTPLSAEGVDAINPPSGTQYTIVKANDHTSMNTGYTAENFDKCYGHPEATYTYHYHYPPPCITGWAPSSLPIGNSATSSYSSTYGDVANSNTGSMTVTGYASGSSSWGKIYGIAYDGWPVYGPYDSNGNAWTDRDNCGGKLLDNNTSYAYFMAYEFPYILGCYGPGTYNESSTSSSSSSSSSSNTQAIVIGVCVGLGVPILIALGAYAVILRRNKRRRQLDEPSIAFSSIN